MNSNPDKIYWSKAAKDPVAPATLWLYPKLKYFERSVQRSALHVAKNNAMRHWLSHVLRWMVSASAAAQIFAMVTDYSDLRQTLSYALPVAVLTWLIQLDVLTRLELRRAMTPEMRRAVDA